MLNAYYPYFGGCAAVAGTLIGLLFVAISVSPHKDVGRDAPLSFQVQAAVAFVALVDALVVALVGLLPGNNFSFGGTAVILACVGISSTIGMAMLTLRRWPGRRHLWGLVMIPVLGVLFILQLVNGIDMVRRPSGANDVHFQALLLIFFFVIAIARAWQMIGVRGTRMMTLVGELVRDRQAHRTAVPEGPPSVRGADRGNTTQVHPPRPAEREAEGELAMLPEQELTDEWLAAWGGPSVPCCTSPSPSSPRSEGSSSTDTIPGSPLRKRTDMLDGASHA